MPLKECEKEIIPVWRLRAFVQEHLQGKCKILSQGSNCTCALCDLERMYTALRWYGDETEALAFNLLNKKDTAVLASVQVFSLDAGKRVNDVLGKR